MLLDQDLSPLERVGQHARSPSQSLGKGASWHRVGRAVKIPDLKSALPGFINTFQRGCRSVVETNSPQGFSSASSAWRVLTLKSSRSHLLPQRGSLSLQLTSELYKWRGYRSRRIHPTFPRLLANVQREPSGRQQVRGMLAAVGRVVILCDGQQF